MSAPRTGSLGVGKVKGDIYIVNDAEELETVPVGTDGQVLVADSVSSLGVSWKTSSATACASFFFDATTAIFHKINLGSGEINNPEAKKVGSNSALSFSATTVEGIAWQGYMPSLYAPGTGLTVKVYWNAAMATSGSVVWQGAFERQIAGDSALTDGFAALQSAAPSAAPAILGDIAVATITFTSAQIDGIAAGEPLKFFLQRHTSNPSDDMSGKADMLRVVVEN